MPSLLKFIGSVQFNTSIEWTSELFNRQNKKKENSKNAYIVEFSGAKFSGIDILKQLAWINQINEL